MMRPLGARVIQVLRVIADYIEEHGLPPSFREVGEGAGLSSMSTVYHHITTLRERGLLVNHSIKTRALVPTREGYQAIGRDQHPPSHLMPGPDQQPRMQVIPRHICDALGWLSSDVSMARQRGRTVPGYAERIAQWWDKIRRDDVDA